MNRTQRVVDARLMVEDGNLLVSWSATLDAFIWRGENAWLNQHIFKVVPDESRVCHGYLFYLLKNEIENLKKSEHLHGSTMMHINRGPFLAHLVPLPSLATQERVAAAIEEMLTELDDAEVALAQAQSDFGTWRKALLKAAVTGELTADWRGANPPTEPSTKILAERRVRWHADASAESRKYVEPVEPNQRELPTLPKAWTWASLDQLSTKITSGSRSWSPFYGRGQSTFIMAQNIRRGHYDGRFRQVIDPPAEDPERVRTAVVRDDLLLTIVGANTGDLCRFNREPDDHYVCQSVALIRLADPSMAAFIEAFFVSDFGRKLQMEPLIYGAGRPHLSFDQIKSLAVPVAPKEERGEIDRLQANIMAELNATVDAMQNGYAAASLLRQSILAAAFRGELVR